jgi:tetratricopeptide (TPR) repeat protein
MASHLYYCYRNFERARVQIQIAAQTLSNSSDLFELTALIDRVQGRWEKAVAALERATALDPRNRELLGYLSDTYWALRRYRDAERILNRAIELEPNQPAFLLSKAQYAYSETADINGARAACESLPSSVKDDPDVASWRVVFAMCARDYAAAKQILSESPDKEIFFGGALVPRPIWALWLEFLQGNHPTMEQFGAVRELYRKAEANPTDSDLLMALALTDVALGRKEEAMQEGRRAMELRPISEDAVDGTGIAYYVAMVYALANQPDLAFEQLNSLVKIPGWFLNYGDLKTNPGWDPLPKDPRFDKLLAELAPRN